MELLLSEHAISPCPVAEMGTSGRFRRRPDRKGLKERRNNSPPSLGLRRGSPSSSKPLAATSLVGVLLVGAALRAVSAWEDCVVSPEDKWKPATQRTPALKMRYEYERRYTCSDERASFLAGSFYFDSPCMSKKFFFPPDVHSCLKGRRVIFLGDSLSNQQGDSLLGMLGWHPDWMTAGNPRNAKQAVDEEGNRYNTLVDCWHPEEDMVRGVERCYDYSSLDFPPATSLAPPGMVEQYYRPSDVPGTPDLEGRLEPSEATEEEAAAESGSGENHDRRGRRRALAGDEELEELDEDGENEISVHMRMFSRPVGDRWLHRAMRDYNETRPSDIVVVNFGGHYHDGPEDGEEFKKDVFPILDEMAELGKNVTVVWREIAPTHFPSVNGSFDTFDSLEVKPRLPCCTGIPPSILDRNVWVEDYLRDNGLLDRVKLLRIYGMSATRGAAHHTCHLAPPSTMDQARAQSSECHPPSGSIDCRHFSETGVVEEWNALFLSHICPAAT